MPCTDIGEHAVLRPVAHRVADTRDSDDPDAMQEVSGSNAVPCIRNLRNLVIRERACSAGACTKAPGSTGMAGNRSASLGHGLLRVVLPRTRTRTATNAKTQWIRNEGIPPIRNG